MQSFSSTLTFFLTSSPSISTMSAPAGYTIHVSGLSPETSEDKLRDFFSVGGSKSH